MAHAAFISHSSRDKPTSDAVCAALEAEGVRCWIAPRDILPGAVWLNAITEAIDVSQVVVLILSSAANDSVQVVRELQRAVEKKIPLVPVCVEAGCDTENLDHLIQVVHWLDASTGPLEQHLPLLVQAVCQHLRAREPAAGRGTLRPGEGSPSASAAVPSTTFTFLLTDVEPATQLWQQDRQATAATIARYDALLQSVLEAHGGRVFKTGSDALGAAFASAPAAVMAAVAADRALQAEPRRQTTGLRVRMAIHTGPAEPQDGEYFGPALNRAATLLAFAHGGQILLSRATRELVQDPLPDGVRLRDLGEHCPDGMSRTEPIFQLLTPDAPPNLTPLETPRSARHNLPLHPTPLLGRAHDREVLGDLLQQEETRLVTLTGPGGTGKSRLALEVAGDLVEAFVDGVYFVALASILDSALVPLAIAQTLGVRDEGKPLLPGLKEQLGDQKVLLLLDNFEQVTEAAPVVSELLAGCRHLKVLVTSRTALKLRGEWEFQVPPLDVPDPKRLPPVEELSQYAAVELFIQRARAVKRDFRITNETAPAVAEICHRLDGLPLAIELAAARVKLLPPAAMLARLGRRLPVLTQGPRDMPERHQTLRSAIAWSYDLLEEEEKALFRRLSVFVGGFTLEDAETVCGDGGLGISDGSDGSGARLHSANRALDVLEGVESLVNKSLLQQVPEERGEPRFRMMETIREYGWECLGASGEEAPLRQRHAQHFLALAEEAAPQLLGPAKRAWLDQLEAEHDNLRAALGWCAECGEAEIGLRLGTALWRFWRERGYLSEGRDRLEAVLGLSDAGVSRLVRAKALNAAGALAHDQGDLQRATLVHEEALGMARECADDETIAYSLLSLGNVAITEGKHEEAQAFFEEALGLFRRLGDMCFTSWSLNNLAYLAVGRGDYVEAQSFFRQSLAIKRTVGEQSGIAGSLNNLGNVALRMSDYEQAASLLDESLRLFWELGDSHGLASVLHTLAQVALGQGELARAAILLAKVKGLCETIGRLLPGEFEQNVDAARSGLGAEAFATAWGRGEAMTLPEVVAYAAPPAGVAA